MRFIDLKIRTKLMFAFGVLILIAFLMSVYIFYTLFTFKKQVTSFSGEFLPQLKLSASINNETQMVAFYMESYYLTGNPDYFETARKELDSLKTILSNGEELLVKSKSLDKLEQNLSEARILLPQHEQLAMMSFNVFQEINLLSSRIKSTSVKKTTTEKRTSSSKKKKNVANAQPVASGADNTGLSEKIQELDELKAKDMVVLARLKTASENLRNSVVGYIADFSSQSDHSIRASLVTMTVIIFISLLIAFFSIIYISRIITTPLVKGIDLDRKSVV